MLFIQTYTVRITHMIKTIEIIIISIIKTFVLFNFSSNKITAAVWEIYGNVCVNVSYVTLHM